MKMNPRNILKTTLAASVLAFAGNVAAQSTYPAPSDPYPAVTTYPATTTYYVANTASEPYRVALNEQGAVIVESYPVILFRDRWDIPYKDMAFLLELSRTDGQFAGDPLNPLVKSRGAAAN